jgi:hypothetical protein
VVIHIARGNKLNKKRCVDLRETKTVEAGLAQCGRDGRRPPWTAPWSACQHAAVPPGTSAAGRAAQMKPASDVRAGGGSGAEGRGG